MITLDQNGKKKTKMPIINNRFLSVLLKVLSSKTDLTSKELSNIIKLLDKIDRHYYEEYDISLGALLRAIEIVAKFRLKNKESSEDLSDCILLEIQSSMSDTFQSETLENIIIPILIDSKNKKYEHDAEFINQEIHTYLQYGKILSHRDDFITISNNISTSSGNELKEELNKFHRMLNLFSDYFREVDIENSQHNVIFSTDKTFFDSFAVSHNKSKSPSYMLKTGIQTLNKCFSDRGGMPPGYYLFYANINSFKSGLLEHFVKWIHLYNYDTFRRIKKRTGKKPLLLFCSLENSKQDDDERFTKIYTGRDLHTYGTFDQLESTWKTSIEECAGVTFEELNDVLSVGYYYPTEAIRVSDIRKVITQAEEQNYTIIAVVVDYLEKIKNEIEDQKQNDNYALGKISADLHSLQKSLDCPLITAHQINREGARQLFSNKDAGKANAMTSLNSTYIGKDWDIDKPSSFSGFIDIETDPDTGIKYLTFKKGKQRGKRTDIETFVHELKDGIILEDDIRLPKPLSKEAITPPKCEDMAFHISTKDRTNGQRGRTTNIAQTGDKPIIKTEEKKPTATIKDILKDFGKFTLETAFINLNTRFNMEMRNNPDNIIKSPDGRTYIRGNKFKFKA